MLRWFLFSFIAVLCSGFPLETSANEVGVKPGSKIQHFTLKTLNPKGSGKRMIASRKLIGAKAEIKAKAVGITFGASYCEPCKKELRILAAQTEAIRDAGSILLSVVIDKDPEGIEVMRKLLVDELNVTFPVLSDRFGILARRYKATTLPMMLVIGPDGTVVWVHTGYDKNAIRGFLSRLGLPKNKMNKIKF